MEQYVKVVGFCFFRALQFSGEFDFWVKKLLHKCTHIYGVLFMKEILEVHVASLCEAGHLEKREFFV